MTYRLSDKQLSELVLLVSVQKITEIFPRYSPAARTIYRRLAKHGIIHPLKAHQEFKRELLLAAPPNLTDKDAELLIETKIQALFEELCASIEREARVYQERFDR